MSGPIPQRSVEDYTTDLDASRSMTTRPRSNSNTKKWYNRLSVNLSTRSASSEILPQLNEIFHEPEPEQDIISYSPSRMSDMKALLEKIKEAIESSDDFINQDIILFTHFTFLAKIKNVQIITMNTKLYNAAKVEKFPYFSNLSDFRYYGKLYKMRFNQNHQNNLYMTITPLNESFSKMDPKLFDDQGKRTFNLAKLILTNPEYKKIPGSIDNPVTLSSRGFSGCIGSLYPKTVNGQERHCDPITDDCAFTRLHTDSYDYCGNEELFVFSATDGATSNIGLRAAMVANRKFIDTICMSGKNQDLINLFTGSLNEVNKEVYLTGSSTQHLGILGYTFPNAKKWIIVAGSIGNLALYRYSRSSKKCLQILGSDPAEFYQKTKTTGGGFGKLKDQGVDMGNFTMISYLGDRSDILIALSDGINDNLRPEVLGLTQEEATQYVEKSKDTESTVSQTSSEASYSIWNTEQCSSLSTRFRVKYLADLLRPIENLDVHKIQQAIVSLVVEKTAAKRRWMELERNHTKAQPEIGEMLDLEDGREPQRATGILDHLMCAVIDCNESIYYNHDTF